MCAPTEASQRVGGVVVRLDRRAATSPWARCARRPGSARCGRPARGSPTASASAADCAVGAAVEPDDRRPQRVAAPRRARPAPSTWQARPSIVMSSRPSAGAGARLADGRDQRPRPVRRVLLGPAAGGVAHRAGRARRGERSPLVVGDHRLDALGADVDADHAAHLCDSGAVRGRASASPVASTAPASSSCSGRCLRQPLRAAAISTTQIDDHPREPRVRAHGLLEDLADQQRDHQRGAAEREHAVADHVEAPAGGEVARRGEVGQHVDGEDAEGQQEAEVAVDVRAAGRVAEAAARRRRRRAPARSRRRRWRRSRRTACAAWGR